MKASQRRTFDTKRLSVLIADSERRSSPSRKQREAILSDSADIFDALSSPGEKSPGEPVSDDEGTIVQEERAPNQLDSKKELSYFKRDVLLSETDTQPSVSTVPSGFLIDVIHDTQINLNDVFVSTGSTLSIHKQKLSKLELKETRRKATTRLAEKRRELKLLSLREIETKRYECTLHRVKWRANTKGKRTAELDRQVDRYILRDVILNNPKALAFADQHDFDCITGRFDESVWGDLLSGLELPNNEVEWDIDGDIQYPRISDHILSSVGLAGGNKMNKRLSKFDNDDDKSIRQSVARTFAQKTQALPVATRTGSRVDTSDDLKKSILSTESSEINLISLERLSSTNGHVILAEHMKRTSSQLYNGYILGTLGSGKDRGTEPGSALSRISVQSEQKKPISLFARFLPDKKRNTLEDRNSAGERTNNTPGIGGPGSSIFDDNSCTSDGVHSVRLADSVFLVGPDADEIENLVQQFLVEHGDFYQGGSQKSVRASLNRADKSQSNMNLNTIMNSSSNNLPYSSGSVFEHNLEPKLIYLSHKDPEVEDEVLPFFCYPR